MTAGHSIEVGRSTDPATGQRVRTGTDRTDLRFGYDDAGRLATVTAVELNDVILPEPLVTAYGYDAVGNLVSTRRPNGTAESRRYDARNRLVAVEDTGPDGVVFSRFTYTLDPAGHRTAVDELGGRRVEYTDDALSRLTRETIIEPGSDPRTIAYAYDRVGNRLSRRDSDGGLDPGFTSDTYDARDRLIEEDGSGSRVAYSYDANGNTKTRTDGVTDAVYSWDEEGRLVAAVLTERATGAARHLGYRYNPDGIRVASIDDGRETRSLIDDEQAFDQVLEEYAPGGALAAAYVRGVDLIFQDRGGVRSYYLKDGLGSTRLLTDALGAVTDTYSYDAYGQTISHTGSTPNEYQFAGEVRDAGEQYYLRARSYDAAAGRFTSRDTYEGRLEEPATLNHYAYAAANPVDNVDPSGHDLVSTLSSISLGTFGGFLRGAVGIGIGFSLLVYAQTVANSLTNIPPNPAQMTKISAALALLPGRTSSGISAKATIVDFSVTPFKGTYFAITRPFSFHDIALTDHLLQAVDIEFIASTIAHETKHSLQPIAYRGTPFGEKEAFQAQSDFLGRLGIRGTFQQLSDRFPGTDVNYLRDTAIDFQQRGVRNPAITP